MKTILCYGDSITWGYNPEDGTRFPFDQRWPGILQFELGNRVRVIEEALPGRTTNWDSPYLPGRNGHKTLPLILESHSPIDIVILMLGTNDLWKKYDLSASDIAGSLMPMIWTIQKSQSGPDLSAPEVVLIAPPVLGKLSPFMKFYFDGRVGESKKLAKEIKYAAQSCGCHFIDSSKFMEPSGIDGVHPVKSGHDKLAYGILKYLIDKLQVGYGN